VDADPPDQFPSHPQVRVVVEPNRIWFSILARNLVWRGTFASQHDLKQRIDHFIAYFNRTVAKPFKRTKAGKPLAAGRSNANGCGMSSARH
jgi:hypothetical protein